MLDLTVERVVSEVERIVSANTAVCAPGASVELTDGFGARRAPYTLNA